MYIIELTLKNTPMTLSVQRKSTEDALAVYQQVRATIGSGTTQILELTCERQPEKKIAVITSELSAVQLYEKNSTATSGKPPGFFALSQAE